MKYTITLRLLTFLGVLAGVVFFTLWLVSSSYFESHPGIFSTALTIDFLLILPFIYFLLIRKTRIPYITCIPITLLTYFLIYKILPEGQHLFLGYAEYLLIFLEAFLIIYVIHRTRRLIRKIHTSGLQSGDSLNAIREVLTQSLPGKTLANLAATEISLFYFSLPGLAGPMEFIGNSPFTYHKRSGYSGVLLAFLFVILLESLGLHLLLSNWSTVVAWIITGLSIYGAFFLFGDYRAILKRPVSMNEEYLYLRIGLRWSANIPVEEIEKVEIRKTQPKSRDHADMVLFGSPNVIITFKEEQTAIGMYGIKKRFKSVALSIDQEKEFYTALCEVIEAQ